MGNKVRRRVLALLMLIGGGAVCAAEKENAQVLDVDGQRWSGRVSTLSETAITLRGKTSTRLKTARLLRLTFNRKVRSLAGRAILFLANGDRLIANPVGMNDENVHVRWSLQFSSAESNRTMAIPSETIRGILFAMPATRIARNNIVHTLLNRSATSDAVFLDNGDRLTGELLRMDRETLFLKGPVGKTLLRRADIRAVAFNPDLISLPSSSSRRTGIPRVIVEFIDGSRLTVTGIGLARNRLLTFQTLLGRRVSVPLTAVVTMRFLGGRVVYLSDLKPSSYRFTPFLTTRHTLHRDQNVLGNPLRLRGRDYPRGLGMFSRAAVSYALKGRYLAFRSVVGIDDATEGEGNAVFAVDVDGRRVFTSQPLGGKSPAKQIGSIDLSGAQKITLIVEYGERGDIQDVADWCDAVLITKP